MPRTNVREAKAITIADFTPGIYSQAGGQLYHGLAPAPLGAAHPTETFRCIAYPTGGLGPLPVPSRTLDLPSIDGINVSDDGYVVTGAKALGPYYVQAPSIAGGIHQDVRNKDILHVSLEWITATTRRAAWIKLNAFETPLSMQILNAHTSTRDTTLTRGWYYGTSWAVSRLYDPLNLTSIYPVVVSEWIYFEQQLGVGLSLTDDTFSACSPAPDDATPSNLRMIGFAGALMAHQSRVVQFQWIELNAGVDTVGTLRWANNEWILTNEPPGSPSLVGAGEAMFGREYPFGVGSWASISANELLVIKRQGGALLIMGDVLAPQVTALPGVQPTGDWQMAAVPSPSGFIYLVENNGAWEFTGGASRKISRQLDDNIFFRGNCEIAYPTYGTLFHCARWGTWIMFPNNLLYDTETQSWWNIDSTDVACYQLWTESATHADTVYGIKGRYDVDETDQVGEFIRGDAVPIDLITPGLPSPSPSKLASRWVWQSLPIYSQDPERSVRVLRYEATWYLPVLGAPYELTVGVLDEDDNLSSDVKTGQFATSRENNLVRTRGNLDAKCRGIQIRIDGNSTDPTVIGPILKEVTVFYVDEEPVMAG